MFSAYREQSHNHNVPYKISNNISLFCDNDRSFDVYNKYNLKGSFLNKQLIKQKNPTRPRTSQRTSPRRLGRSIKPIKQNISVEKSAINGKLIMGFTNTSKCLNVCHSFGHSKSILGSPTMTQEQMHKIYMAKCNDLGVIENSTQGIRFREYCHKFCTKGKLVLRDVSTLLTIAWNWF